MSNASIPVAQVRARLLSDASQFLREAQRIPGVLRIALIGSIITAKVAPKDVDLLVTVTDEHDLAPLAKAGRRLKGRCQTYNCGADIFLADPEHRYIGRICHWKECRPGIRASCDAEHCGRRAFLHDDLSAVRLQSDLVSTPPLELWPNVARRGRLPADVEQLLVSGLTVGSTNQRGNRAP